ncbi:MAG: hypothetical protein WBD40_23960 [Tepidisphaeraceae bacterium]
MKFFVDNCLPPRWGPALDALSKEDGHEVLHLRQKFAANTTDIDWIGELAGEGNWVILSGDMRITKLPHEREAWRQAQLTAFFLHKSWSAFRMWDKTWRIVRWWPRIIEQSGLVRAGAGFVIPVNFGTAGAFEQV